MKHRSHDLLTIPNLLSVIRLILIPIFVLLYREGHVYWTAALLVVSGITDIVDGYVARKFGLVTDAGKVLDPIADKLTQTAMLLCLSTRYATMSVPLILLVIKEAFTALSGMVVIKRTGMVPGAEWHGKATTLMLYGMLILHVMWEDIPGNMSNIFSGSCAVMMAVSFILYGVRNIRLIRHYSK